jgi:DNA-directed RNA polymerase III subunit RPC3
LIRYPFILQQVQEEIGEEAEMIVSALLEAGRLTLDQLILAVQSSLKGGRSRLSGLVKSESNPEGLKQDPKSQPSSSDPSRLLGPEAKATVIALMATLASSNYVERAPPCNFPPPSVIQHPASLKGRRGSAKAGSAQAAQEQSMAMHSLRASYEATRFTLNDREGGVGASGVGMKREAEEDEFVASGGGRSAKKRKVTSVLLGSGPLDLLAVAAAANKQASTSASVQIKTEEGGDSSVLWRVNVAEFALRSRDKACIDLVGDKMGKDAGAALAAMLEAIKPGSPASLDSVYNAERSSHATMEDIVACAKRMISQGKISSSLAPSRIPTLVRSIAEDEEELVTSLVSGGTAAGGLFVVNLGRIMDLARLKQLQAVARDKFGVPGLRIFRLLLIRGQLESKQVAEFSTLAPKDTRKLLYDMLLAGLLSLQEIPRTSDRAPSRTFYTWKADHRSGCKRVASEVYGAATRVWLRLGHELSLEQEVIDLIEEGRAKGEMSINLTPVQIQKLGRLKKVGQVLESSLLELTEMMTLFH